MSELYWIGRIGMLATVLEIFIFICIGIGIFAILAYGIARGDCYNKDDVKILNDFYIKSIKIYIPVITIAVILRIFIPNRNELITIYGIGSTIDYIQQNDKAKELPDKVINALDIYLDNINNKKEN